jgi:DNA-binding NarL/FixJ family response regulator
MVRLPCDDSWPAVHGGTSTLPPPETREARERRAPKQSLRRPTDWRRPHAPTARLVIADDHATLRRSVRLLLEKVGLEVVAEAGDGASAARVVCALKPDVAILDIAMPGLDGFEATRQIARRSPGTKVILLSTHSEARYVREGLAAGAVGYVLKNRAGTELVEAIRRVLHGQIYLSTAARLEPVPMHRPESPTEPVPPPG